MTDLYLQVFFGVIRKAILLGQVIYYIWCDRP